MKKILSLAVLFALFVSLTSCGGYKPVESTEKEAEVMMQINLPDAQYDVRYELYRALFLNYKSEYDGGDNSVWTSENKDVYIEKIDKRIKEDISEIYASFYLCKKIGIDVFSKDVEDLIKEYIKVSVDGGEINSMLFEGYDGDYDKYLESLKSINLNYSTQVLLFRYAIAVEMIDLYYRGTMNEEFLPDASMGKLEYTREDVYEFYDSADTTRVLWAFLPDEYFTRERAENIRITLEGKNGEEEVATYIINLSTAGATDIKKGVLIGKYNFNTSYYDEIVSEAKELDMFEVSSVIEYKNGQDSGHVILYKCAKTQAHFDEYYDSIVGDYLDNEIGKFFFENQTQILNSLTYTDAFLNLDRSGISMDE